MHKEMMMMMMIIIIIIIIIIIFHVMLRVNLENPHYKWETVIIERTSPSYH